MPVILPLVTIMWRDSSPIFMPGRALQLGHQVEARQGGVEVVAQPAADLAFDQVAAGQHAQPQAQRVVVVGRGAGFQVGVSVMAEKLPGGRLVGGRRRRGRAARRVRLSGGAMSGKVARSGERNSVAMR